MSRACLELSWPDMASKMTSRAPGTCSTASKTPSGISHTAPKTSKTPPRASQNAPKTRPEKGKNRKFHHVVQFARFPRPSWGIFAQHGRQNSSKMPPRASKVCLRPSRPLPKSASKSLLLRPRPFTKGGLAVVRPRRPSSIRQTTLVSHGRVQDRGRDLPSSKSF